MLYTFIYSFFIIIIFLLMLKNTYLKGNLKLNNVMKIKYELKIFSKIISYKEQRTFKKINLKANPNPT